MTWSVNAVGKPLAVKAALVAQFKQAYVGTAHMPHEQATVAAAEQMVNTELDFLAGCKGVAVHVQGGGSAYKDTQGNGSTSMTLKVEPLYGFVE